MQLLGLCGLSAGFDDWMTVPNFHTRTRRPWCITRAAAIMSTPEQDGSGDVPMENGGVAGDEGSYAAADSDNVQNGGTEATAADADGEGYGDAEDDASDDGGIPLNAVWTEYKTEEGESYFYNSVQNSTDLVAMQPRRCCVLTTLAFAGNGSDPMGAPRPRRR